MKTLEEIKNEVAKDHGWDRYSQIEQAFRGGVISEHSFNDFLTDVCKDYAQLACEDLRERIAETAKVNFDCNVWNCEGQSVNKDSIRNVEIILK